ncbi:MAG TPA: hypothetical protein VF532_20585 [Candidatus Angelobacter sp.]
MGKTSKESLNPTVNLSGLVPVERMRGDSKKDERLLRDMAIEASEYLLSFTWCKSIRRAWFGWGVGGVCAVFLLEIESGSKKVDSLLWVVVGDIPPAYLVIDSSPTPLSALRNYTELMQKWVDAVKARKSVATRIPVNAPATIQYANLLQKRLDFIEKEFLN